MIKVRFFTLLRLKLGISEVDVDVDEIVLRELVYKIKDIVGSDIVEKKIVAEDGSLRRGINILVNGHNILSLERLDTIIKAGDAVSLFPVGGGG